ncbi:hypothetical protein PENSPDRAFT_692974 [Peniophora sp. CONT]|nr:hypothetical protein PENSPDRAFT_692974 [Peniophora sp. CONT]
MRLNFTAKDIGHSDLVDDTTNQLQYTVRTNVDGKMKTIRRPTKEPPSDGPDHRGLFIARFHLHVITSDKVELQEDEQLKVREWMQEEGNKRTFTAGSGKKYAWSSRQHGDAILQDENDKQVAYLYDRSSGLFGGEERSRAALEVDDNVKDILDDIVVSCLYFKLAGQHTGIFGTSMGNGLANAIAYGTPLSF